MVSDMSKNFGGSTDLAQKRYGSADLHTPIHPPPRCENKQMVVCREFKEASGIPGVAVNSGCPYVVGGSDNNKLKDVQKYGPERDA